MSRIFDALQRLESERSQSDSEAPTHGHELLKRAEDLAASKWKDQAAPRDHSTEPAMERNALHQADGAPLQSPTVAESAERQHLSVEERRKALSQFKSVPISLSSQSRLVCLTDRESPTAEALRLLGVRLRDLRRQKPLKRVLITSTIPQEGKSTISGNLACTLSHATEERILLVEGDLRRPSLSRMFGLQVTSGICDYLQDRASLQQSVYHLEGASLWMLPAGHASSNPLELLQSPKLQMLMDKLATYFDWIIIDSPPVLPLADTSIWMRIADGIFLVTRQGTTEKRQLQKGLEALDPQKTLGALLNGSIASAYSGYYYRAANRS
jgi:capsular exopolysaccharide synthesis family protein